MPRRRRKPSWREVEFKSPWQIVRKSMEVGVLSLNPRVLDNWGLKSRLLIGWPLELACSVLVLILSWSALDLEAWGPGLPTLLGVCLLLGAASFTLSLTGFWYPMPLLLVAVGIPFYMDPLSGYSLFYCMLLLGCVGLGIFIPAEVRVLREFYRRRRGGRREYDPYYERLRRVGGIVLRKPSWCSEEEWKIILRGKDIIGFSGVAFVIYSMAIPVWYLYFLSLSGG